MSGGSLRRRPRPLAAAWLLLFAPTVLFGPVPGCSSGEGPGPPPEATSTTMHDGSFLPAAELLAILSHGGGRAEGCRHPWIEPVFMSDGEPPAREALGCEGLSARTYRNQAEVEAALQASSGFCSYRAVGQGWIITVDDPDRVAEVAEQLGGEPWMSPACADPAPPDPAPPEDVPSTPTSNVGA